MSLLDDPSLSLRASTAALTEGVCRSVRVKFLPASAFACDMRISAGAIGEVRNSYAREGCEMVSLWIDGVGLATGVPASELEELRL